MASDRWARVKPIIECVVLLDRLVPVFGLGSLSAILWGVWGSISSMSPIEIGLTMFGALTLTVFLINGIRAYLKGRADRLIAQSFKGWELVTKLPFGDVAYLWAGSYDPKAARLYLKMLKEQAALGHLKAEKINSEDYNVNSLVTREELVKLARRIGDRPKFLFETHS